MNPLREAVLAEASTWLRTPYHHHAQIKGVGVDCAHLLRAVYVAAGAVEPFDIEPYPPDWWMHRSEELFLGYVKRLGVEVQRPEPGDVVVYKFGRCFAHGGIVVNWPGEIIHAYFKSRNVELAHGDAGELTGRERLFFSVGP